MEDCIVCDQNDWKCLYTIKNWEILQCQNCNYARIDKFPELSTRQDFYSKESIEKRKKKKKRNLGKKIAAFIRHYLRKLSGRNKGTIFKSQLHKYLPKGKRVLDIGCGNGAIISQICDEYECVGVEVSEHMALHVQNEFKVKTFSGNFQEVDFGALKFDAVMMISLLEHLPDPFESLSKCYDLLDDGSLLLLKTVNHEGFNRNFFKDKWTGYRPPDHMVYFGKNNLRIMMEKIGFRNIKMSGGIFNDSFYCEAIK